MSHLNLFAKFTCLVPHLLSHNSLYLLELLELQLCDSPMKNALLSSLAFYDLYVSFCHLLAHDHETIYQVRQGSFV